MLTLDAQVMLTWVSLIIAVVGAIAAAARWMVRSLDRRIKELTKPIQPDANGGSSLPDVARSLSALAQAHDRSVVRLHGRIDELGGDVRDLQLWAADRPCLLDRHDRVSRAKRRLMEEDCDNIEE